MNKFKNIKRWSRSSNRISKLRSESGAFEIGTELSRDHTINHAADLLRNSKKIIVLTGAGISVSCGIPDFRSCDGIYARLSGDYPDLPNPQAMFDINYFRQNPQPFFDFAKEIYPGQFEPSPTHRFIRLLEKQGRLLRNYTQNIDTLEQVAGIQNVITCHGSFATSTCTVCQYQVDSSVIKEDVFNQVIPYCAVCPTEERGIMKPDIVFFGEGLPHDFDRYLETDTQNCDLLIVIGTSLRVEPVSLIPTFIPRHIPKLLINREAIQKQNFDLELLGDCDNVVGELLNQLKSEWEIDDSMLFPQIKETGVTPPATGFRERNILVPQAVQTIKGRPKKGMPGLKENRPPMVTRSMKKASINGVLTRAMKAKKNMKSLKK